MGSQVSARIITLSFLITFVEGGVGGRQNDGNYVIKKRSLKEISKIFFETCICVCVCGGVSIGNGTDPLNSG